jgi:hypothetical protein
VNEVLPALGGASFDVGAFSQFIARRREPVARSLFKQRDQEIKEDEKESVFVLISDGANNRNVIESALEQSLFRPL